MSTPRLDVIVPVHGAAAAFERCAASLARHVAPDVHRLILVLDGPPDVETRAAVDQLAHGGRDIVVLEHPAPLGFVASVNRAFAVSDRDVVLLNSDTQVTAGWLEKLAAAAADPRIATVTPFSNNATICSLPTAPAENTLPAGFDVDGFAALVERVSTREYPRLPTGVGACLYIRRRVLDEVGLFDPAFGPGYGEEIDFCLRASARGYHHVLDDATFIFHEGSRSFGTSRTRRVRRAERRIRTRYPHWPATVSAFLRTDPLAPARRRVLAALRPAGAAPVRSGSDRVLHVVHGWPPWARGGAELYAWWLAHEQARTREVAVYARYTDPDRELGDAVEHVDAGVRVRLVVNNFTQRNPICRNGLHCPVIARDFARYLDEVRPTLVHVHHLAGHCASLLGVIARRNIPIVYQAQDWWALCARTNLYDREHRLCEGPAPFRCARCLPLTNVGPAPTTSALLHRARAAWMRAQLARVDAVVMGSAFIADSYRHWQVLPSRAAVHVLPYGVPGDGVATPLRSTTSRPLRFGYVGALLPHKGVHICVDAFKRVDGARAELHVWGSSGDDRYCAQLRSSVSDVAHIHLHGAFAETDKPAILQSLDALIVPSTGLESFGLAAREAMREGVPVLASRRGALIELFADGEAGAWLAPDDAGDLARLIARVIDEPRLLDGWRHAIPAVKTVAAHAREIDGVYRSLSHPRRR